MAGLVVVHPGLSSTIQDQGRCGGRAWGVPVSGAFDADSLAVANSLLGNDPGAAAIEMTSFGGRYKAQVPLAIALAGAPMESILVRYDGSSQSLSIPLCLSLQPGERLEIGGAEAGVRTYLAVKGGWSSPLVLGSRSDETRLTAGMEMEASPSATPTRYPRLPDWLVVGAESRERPIRIVDGPDARGVDEMAARLGAEFQVTRQCDRMGLRLAGAPITVRTPAERLSRPIAPGTIQAAGGQLLVLGVGCGTMGGYPHIAQVISADLARIGQLREGDRLRFQRVELAEARRLDREKRNELQTLGRRLCTLAGDSWPDLVATGRAPH